MLDGLTIILVCQLMGELIAVATELPLPGPVIGMAILFTGLAVRGDIPEPVAQAGDGLLSALSLMFVPAGVGIILHAPLLMRDGASISVGLVVSTVLTIIVTGLLMQRLTRRSTEAAADPNSGPRDER